LSPLPSDAALDDKIGLGSPDDPDPLLTRGHQLFSKVSSRSGPPIQGCPAQGIDPDGRLRVPAWAAGSLQELASGGNALVAGN
jgi:hypothetical protein